MDNRKDEPDLEDCGRNPSLWKQSLNANKRPTQTDFSCKQAPLTTHTAAYAALAFAVYAMVAEADQTVFPKGFTNQKRRTLCDGNRVRLG